VRITTHLSDGAIYEELFLILYYGTRQYGGAKLTKTSFALDHIQSHISKKLRRQKSARVLV